MKPTDFDQFWAGIENDLNLVALEPELKELPIRSKAEFSVYGLWLSSVRGCRIFAYYSVPKGEGPFPVIYHLPNYGSVVHIPPFEERCKYICVALCHRGQRLSDQSFNAKYPGLLTMGIESAESYIYREIAGDCLRIIDFLWHQEEVDSNRICLLGGELALWTRLLGLQQRGSTMYLHSITDHWKGHLKRVTTPWKSLMITYETYRSPD
jgi:cephalosporin-C deacetylase-like acetyl esterase